MRSYPPLDELADRGMRLGLDGMFDLFSRLERPNPHCAYPSILIAGSNGKGSTAAGIASGLKSCGLRVGLSTSPHLVSVNERIQIDGRPISDEEFVSFFERLRPLFELCRTTYFEAVTAMSLLCFAEKGVDVAVVEVGMGGRYDATNLLESSVYAFTDISLEHTQYLGKTLAAVASEKAAVLKEQDAFGRRPGAVILDQDPEVIGVFKKVSREKDLTLDVIEAPSGSYKERSLSLAKLTLERFGEVTGISLDSKRLEAGIQKTFWPGRFHCVERPNRPLVVLDGAHNPAGAKALVDLFRKKFPGRKPVFLTMILRDKDVSGVLEEFAHLAMGFVFTQVDSMKDRVSDSADYHVAIPHAMIADPSEALARAEELAGPDGIVLVAGSLYLVGEIYSCLGIDPFALEEGRQ